MARRTVFLENALTSAMLFALLTFSGSTLADGQTETILHTFTLGSKTDGAYSFSPLAYSAGVFYGTTRAGGAHNRGTVYQLAPPTSKGGPWREKLIFSFGKTTGQDPTGTLLLNATTGKIYGTTLGTGDQSDPWGTVYELTPPPPSGGPWTEAVLYKFAGGHDGAYPESGLVSDEQGNLYGTCAGGGQGAGGVVFRLSPPAQEGGAWTETLLHGFTIGGIHGSALRGGLVFDGTGSLYGTTSLGGDHTCNAGRGCGTVFKLAPPTDPGGAWTASVLYTFHATDGLLPYSTLVFDGSGSLYGTTYQGGHGSKDLCCGTVFRLTPPADGSVPWILTTLYAFEGASDGENPHSGLVFDVTGALYGTTTQGGINACTNPNGCGTVFRLNPPAQEGGSWTKEELYQFIGGNDGWDPETSLFLFGNKVYGTTAFGGANNAGTVFEIAP